jgi:flagellar basal-body rod protein FlgB
MFEKLELTRMAQTMAAQAGARLGMIAQNVANADTPKYKAADMPTFAESYSEPDTQMRATRAGHFGGGGGDLPPPVIHRSNGGGSPNGNTVSLEQEMVKAAAARQDHDMALAIYRNTSSILRAALGRQG